ncbi:hypothetical protein EC968_006552 [Mortierella alpina]|nr:hypothetical protein EC968_006552 [Mortierella alpina]
MGLKDFFKTLAKKGLKPTGADLSEIEKNATVDIDLLGTPVFRNFMIRHITEAYDASSALATGTALANYIHSVFGASDRTIRIHLDGAPNEEKSHAHEARSTQKAKNIEVLTGEIAKMRERSEQGRWTCQTTITRITKLLHQIFVLDTTDKASLVQGMRSQAGIIVCECRSESDTCIARTSTPGPRVVVSGDSDLMAYRTVDRVLRSIPRTHDFGWYSKDEILSALGLPTALHLVLLAIVSYNDYGSNIKGLGVVGNCNIIRQLPQSTYGDIDQMLEAYVAAAEARMKKPVNISRFDNARRIFFDHTETLSDHSSTSNESFTLHTQEFQRLKDLRFHLAMEARVARPGPVPFYVAKRSKRNQFRPIFGTKDSILSGSKKVDITRTRHHDGPAPRKGPATKHRKRAKRAMKKRQKIHKKTKTDDEGTDRRKLQISTRRDHALRSKFTCKTLKIGSVHGNLVRTGSMDAREAKTVAETIQGAAAILNKIQVHAYELIALDIASIISPDTLESTSSSSSSATPRLSASQKSDLADILESDAFYFSIATLLCQGSLGANSQYQRQLDAPPRTMGTRRTAAGTPRTIEVPHAQRAFDRYKEASGFRPFFDRQPQIGRRGRVHSTTGGPTFPTTVARLSLSSVKAAVRMHYLGSKFGEEERPDEANPIEYFFEKNREDRQFADFPKGKFAPGYIFLSEADLVNILYSSPATQPIIAKVMEGSSKTAAEKSVVGTKGVLIKQLFYDTDSQKRLDGYHRKVSLQRDTAKTTKYKLRGTICTNGLVLNLLAYDTTAPRRKRQDHPPPSEESSSTRRASGSSSQQLGSESDHDDDDLFGLERELEQDFLLDEAFLFTEDDDEEGEEEEKENEEEEEEEEEEEVSDEEEEVQEASSATAMEWQAEPSAGPSIRAKRPRSSDTASTINWKRGSKILKNIETVFVMPEDCPNAAESIIIGIDPGEIKTACATRIGPVSDSTRVSVDVNRSFLYRPYTKFRQLLQERKAADGIDVLESRMPSLTIQGVRGYLEYLRDNNTREQLFNFYHSWWYLRKHWDMRKAQEASYDYAIKSIMALGGVSDSVKRDESQPNVVFAVGLGSFNSQTGLPSKHGVLIRKLVTRARSLGYGVFGVHEYFTSAKCPRRSCTSFLQSIPKSRSKYCQNCRAYFDRDHVGSENIGTICQMQMLHQYRPQKYMPND